MNVRLIISSLLINFLIGLLLASTAVTIGSIPKSHGGPIVLITASVGILLSIGQILVIGLMLLLRRIFQIKSPTLLVFLAAMIIGTMVGGWLVYQNSDSMDSPRGFCSFPPELGTAKFCWECIGVFIMDCVLATVFGIAYSVLCLISAPINGLRQIASNYIKG